MINGNTKLLCLLGSPVEHSFSPIMHNDSLERMNLNAQYMAFNIKTELLSESLKGLKALGFIGANITIPHKVNVMKYLDFIDEKAKMIGAVNTIVNVNDRLFGYNTDVVGFIESFKLRNINLYNKKICVFGAGGAAKAIIVGLLFEKVEHIDIFSRKRFQFNDIFDEISIDLFKDTKLKFLVYDEFDSGYLYDIVINTTPVGMYPNVDELIIDVKSVGYKDTVFYDLIYNPLETKFLKEARKSNRLGINGLDMLILQGIYSLKHWFPNVDVENKIQRDTVMNTLKKNNIIL